MPMSFVFLVALRSTEERIVSVTQEKRVSPPQGFSLIIQFEGVESTQWIAGYEGDDEGIFSVKYLPSRFDKIGVPQMNTEQFCDPHHTFWRRKGGKQTKQGHVHVHTNVQVSGHL